MGHFSSNHARFPGNASCVAHGRVVFVLMNIVQSLSVNRLQFTTSFVDYKVVLQYLWISTAVVYTMYMYILYMVYIMCLQAQYRVRAYMYMYFVNNGLICKVH